MSLTSISWLILIFLTLFLSLVLLIRLLNLSKNKKPFGGGDLLISLLLLLPLSTGTFLHLFGIFGVAGIILVSSWLALLLLVRLFYLYLVKKPPFGGDWVLASLIFIIGLILFAGAFLVSISLGF